MRIALIGPVPPNLGAATPGGVATHQVHLAAGLTAAGVHAPVLATNAFAPAGAWRAEVDEAPFPLYRMPRPYTQRGAFIAAVGIRPIVSYALSMGVRPQRGSRREILTNLLWYRRFLAEVRPDLIHVQHPLERCLYVRTVLRLERRRVPLVVTAHSLFGEHSDEAIDTLMAPNLRAADRVIAVSDHIASQAVELGVDRRRVRVVRSGVDTERFRPRNRSNARRRLGLPDTAPVVLFVGNLEPRKQVDVLLRSIACVRPHVRTVVLVIVGSGENAGALDQTAQLVQLTEQLQLDREVVQFVGSVGDHQLLDYYAAADVFVLPSSSEAQGIVVLEAMACELPVVATAVGGLLGTIQDGETGFLVPTGDVDALANRLLTVLTDAPLRRAIGHAARRAVERDFSWPRSIEATISVYREVLECR